MEQQALTLPNVIKTVLATILVVMAGSMCLRFAGRKSISQMTVAETVVMISIGNVIVQPLVERSLPLMLIVAFTMVLTMIMLARLQIRYNIIENIFTGKAVTVIENGEIQVENLSRIIMTVDQLETQLRQANISKISDVKTATIEPNGQLGFVLYPHVQAATQEDINKLRNDIKILIQTLESCGFITQAQADRKWSGKNPLQQAAEGDLFQEVVENPAAGDFLKGGPFKSLH